MFEVTVEHTFAAGHALRNYKGKCENVHGHNFKVEVRIVGEVLDEAGMLVDFVDVKKVLRAATERLDHQFLNDVPPFDLKNPSAENIAWYLHGAMTTGLASTPVPVRVTEVRVWETDIQSAIYRP
jgi:6-pyruvoyltetrahydropterin/6-carboxytetrahydropterin synthase